MTSQIALMNQLGIAVASDTLTSRHESSGDTKTYPASSKLYDIGAQHKVVIAHCGTTRLSSSHYRMLISEWALTLTVPFNRVEDYANSFVAWVEANAVSLFFDEKRNIEYSLHTEFLKILNSDPKFFELEVGKHFVDTPSTSQGDFEKATQDKMTEIVGDRYSGDSYKDLTKTSAKSLLKKLQIEPVDILMSILLGEKRNFEAGKDFSSFITSIAVDFLMRFIDSSEGASLNFVGFGAQERLGRCVELAIDTYYGGKLRCRITVNGSDDPNWYPSWNVFAQGEAILKFLRGINPELLGTIARSIDKNLSNELAPAEKVSETVDKIMVDLSAQLEESYISPMMLTIGALGVGGLTRLADMLVRMEALRSASLEGEATVGGYVESLSITREHGVEWHRRMSVDQHSLEDSTHVFA